MVQKDLDYTARRVIDTLEMILGSEANSVKFTHRKEAREALNAFWKASEYGELIWVKKEAHDD